MANNGICLCCGKFIEQGDNGYPNAVFIESIIYRYAFGAATKLDGSGLYVCLDCVSKWQTSLQVAAKSYYQP